MTRTNVRQGSMALTAGLAGLAIASMMALGQGGQGGQGGRGAAPTGPPPRDLRPLLTPKRSEMRFVVTRYTADRTLLATNYAGRAGGGGGGGGGRGTTTTPPISAARIARLKRFDLSWQAATDRLDATKLSPAAQTDLAELKRTIQTNLAQLESQITTLDRILPLAPFTSELVGMIEARIAVKDMDWEKTAGALTTIVRQVKDLESQLKSGALRAGSNARLAADAVDSVRTDLREWNTFYNGYDPLFTWWVAMPYKSIDAELQTYATLLRDPAAANTGSTFQAVPLRIDPAPVPKYPEVPDLEEILALPQDEMTGIVQQFLGGGGRGAGRNAQDAADWLEALKSLDFDALSRNAQVDYLFIKKRAELDLSRRGRPLPTNNPRKTDSSGIRGDARGREGIIRDLEDQLIPYTPAQLIVLAEREFAWCEAEMRKASREMGFGDDWKKALEKTKTMHPPPGGQPAMIRDLLTEAVDFVRARDLVTIPQVDAESLHMIMMTPERQAVNPFFTGGTQISVSFPTNTMEFDAREQSMRGNNRPWSHATAFHEMIPGHNLVAYMNQRYNGYRPSLGGTPFFGEGWAVYWELILYDMGFNQTPEERVGALFWRMHRCARIIFSLRFHMGEWSPQEAIDFLVDRVGHERDNATAEVRRSFQGTDGPLYQAAYLLGALQLRELRKDLVDSRLITDKAFHDEILRIGSMPIDLIRLALTRQKLTRDMSIDWKFYGDLPER